jgi:hypothetical protein
VIGNIAAYVFLVAAQATSTTLTADVNPVDAGSPVTFTASRLSHFCPIYTEDHVSMVMTKTPCALAGNRARQCGTNDIRRAQA